METPKLTRLTTDEIVMLHVYRDLPPEHQEHLRELAVAMHKRLIAARPSNVVLLSDPLRKFAKPRR